MKYKIGDVSKILGISADLLRYYEKKGVVTPEKNVHNDYRYYDSWDINFLIDCLWFKNFGFSIEQIADIVRIPSAGDLIGLMEKKEDELRATIERCNLLLERSGQYRSDLEMSERLLYKCEITQSPDKVRFINRVGNDYPTNTGFESLARRWLSAMPFNHRYFEFPGNGLPENEDACYWGLSLDMSYVKRLDFQISEPMVRVSSRRSIHTVFKSHGGRGGFAPSLLQYALDYAAQNGFTIRDRIHGVLLSSIQEGDKLYGYFEAWLPIE